MVPAEETVTEIMFRSKHYGLMRTMGKDTSALPDLMHFPYFTECLFLMHYSPANRRKMPSLFFLVDTMVLRAESHLPEQSSGFCSHPEQWMV